MTTREWFRIYRGAYWERDPLTAFAVDQVATIIHNGNNPLEGCAWIRLGPAVAMLADVETYQRRLDLFAAAQRDMRQALIRILSGRVD